MTALSEIRDNWPAEEAEYAAYGEMVRSELSRTLTLSNVWFDRVTCRVKSLDSMLKKAIRESYGYEQIEDKVGVRAVVLFNSDVERASDVVVSSFGGEVDDKSASGPIDAFDYRSVHIQIAGLESGEHEGKTCEVQIRTVCSDAWATLSHVLQYKQESGTPQDIRRRQAMLSALFELADAEYERQHIAMVSHPDFPVLSMLSDISSEYLRLGGAEYDRTLAIRSFEALLEAYPGVPIPDVSDVVVTFARSHADWLRATYSQRRDAPGSVFLSQPESLIVAERLVSGSLALREVWDAVYDPAELDALAFAYGLPVDDSD